MAGRRALTLFGRILGWLLLGALGLLALLLVLAWVGVRVPLQRVAPAIEPVVENALGAQLGFAEDSYLVVSLQPGVDVRGLTLRGGDIDLAVDRFSADIGLLALLRNRLRIGEVALEGARLEMTRRVADGADTPRRERNPGGGARRIRSMTIDEIVVADVTVMVTDADTGDTWRFAVTGLDLEMPEPGELLASLEGSYQATPVAAQIETRRADDGWHLERLLVTGPSSRLFVSSRLESAPMRGDARLEFALTSEESFRRWLGERAAPLAPLRLEADATIADNRGSIEVGRLLIGPAEFVGTAALDLSGERPRVELALQSDGFDAEPLVQPATTGSVAPVVEDAPVVPQARTVRNSREAETAPPLAELIAPYLQAMDVDLSILVDRVDGLALDVASLSIRTQLAEGRLDLPVGIVLADVPFEGRVGIETVDRDLIVTSELVAPASDIGQFANAFFNTDTVRGSHGGLKIAMQASGESLRDVLASFRLEGDLRDAELSYGDRPVGFELERMEFSAAMLEAAQARASGVLLGHRFNAELETVPIATVLRKEGWNTRLEVTAQDTRIALDGSLEAGAAGMAFALTSRNPDVIRDWLGVQLSRPVPVAVEGKASRGDGRLRVVIDPFRVGRSSVMLDAYTSGPNADYKVSAKVRGEQVDLEELAELFSGAGDQGAVAASRGSGVRLDIPILPSDYQILDADFDLGLDDLSYARLRADTIRLVGRSRDGRIRAGALTARTPYGAFDGEISIDLASSRPELSIQAEAQPLRLGTLLGDLGVVDEALMEADSAGIRFAISGQTMNEMFKSVDTEFRLRNGSWDMLPDLGMIVRFEQAHFVARGSDPVKIGFAGDIDGQPMRLDVEMTSLAEVVERKAATLDLAAALGELRFETSLASRLPLGSEASSVGVNLESPGLDELNELLGLDLPPWGPVHVSGELSHRAGVYAMPDARVAIGDSSLLGAMTLDVTGRPRLQLEFEAPLIQLDDFRSPEWSASRRPDRRADGAPDEAEADDENREALLSEAAFDRLDATFALTVNEVRSGPDRLGAGIVEASLEDGVFDLARLGLELPGGEMEARGHMRWRDAQHLNAHMELDVDKLDYGVLARRIDPASSMKGIFSLFARLDADYVATRGMMSGASGGLVFGVWPEDFKSGIFDLWAIGLANALMPRLDKESASVINCIVGGFNLENGRLEERVIFADTSRIQASGEIDADFGARELDAYLVPKPKRAQIFSFGAPLTVDGEFDDYSIGIRTRDLIAAIFRFVASPVVAPIRWATEEPVPRDGIEACASAWQTNIGGGTGDAQ